MMGHDNSLDTNQNHVSFSLFDFSVSPDQISQELNLSPMSTGIKGEHYQIGAPTNRIDKTRDTNHWQYEWKIHTNEFIGDIAERFVNEIIVPRIEILSTLSKTSSIQFQIVQYYYDGCNPGVCLEKETMQILSKIGASLDIDIYCLGE